MTNAERKRSYDLYRGGIGRAALCGRLVRAETRAEELESLLTEDIAMTDGIVRHRLVESLRDVDARWSE